MTRFGLVILLGGLWGTGACGQSGTDVAQRVGPAVDLARRPAHDAQGTDPLVRQADDLVRAGRPWRASALLAARLAQPANASPELRLAGARAAAGWEGWSEVTRLLHDAEWLDRDFGGNARELLARGELESGQDAIGDARLALAAARDEPTRVVRRVLLARAYDRANATDSAGAAYAAASQQLPRVADWLRLRQAGLLGDSVARARELARVTGPVARTRVLATDAQARERSGDFAGAARSWQAAGVMASAFRASALADRDDVARAALATRIAAWLALSHPAAEVRATLEVLDKLALPLTPAQDVVVARAAAEAGSAARAVAGFSRAVAAAPLPARDRFAYAGALLRAGRAAESARAFAALSGDSTLAPAASFQRARALLAANDGSGARDGLRATVMTYAASPAAAAPALLLLADLQVDDGDLVGAAASLARLGARYPSASQAPLARLRAGIIAWTSDPRASAAQFDTLVMRYPRDEEAVAARYWAARADDRLGQRAAAERRWREIIASSPLSYYAGLSAHRLKFPTWSPPQGADSAAHVPSIDSAAARIVTLDILGMDAERRFELDALSERAEREPAIAAAAAQAIAAAGEPARALRVAVKALQHGIPTRPLLRAAYPIVHPDALAEEARRNALDAALVAGLIRQESSWNPRATSPVGARGLMQVMPAVGATVASRRHYPFWNPALLFDPDVSLELGTAHLAASLARGAPVAQALAAYNAGESRVARWLARPGATDPELFSEWIPFVETRDYVRVVQRNADVYRALYDLR